MTRIFPHALARTGGLSFSSPDASPVAQSHTGLNAAATADQQTGPAFNSGPRFPRWIRIGFWVCIVIAVAAVVLRAIALALPVRTGGPPGTAELDAYFKAHAAITWTHILCALGYVVLLPFCFWKRTRNSLAVQRAFFAMGLVIAATAYAMDRYAIGGWVERAAILFFNLLFLAELARAWLMRRRGNHLSARLWSVRATAVLLGIATTRPVIGIFFATSALTHLSPQQFFGYAFWIGFSITTVAIELWLRLRPRQAERILL